ncbi:MAG TPA: leucyl/phenylalanyl-tRNA--protein transferase [Roseiflexaceae bacterium]|nr:leucyl/phenylalanyl-tRNA--protein transferase [Roseiflexaceae bacterium]HMP42453.1 leucyl/phenylalanyl-tRNA--protein transferase [Roseiflexaceae bacterium]
MRLTPDLLLSAYCQGFFPMSDAEGAIRWYDPHPRAVIPLDTFHVPRRLARTVRNGGLEIRYDTSFATVMRYCALPAPGRETTWISEELIAAYHQLHNLGFAHSVECWRNEVLVGGLYGVAVRGLFAGESMFSFERDASKVALVHLVDRLRRGKFVLLDSQYIVGQHMLQFGTIEISRNEYRRRLAQALTRDARF